MKRIALALLLLAAPAHAAGVFTDSITTYAGNYPANVDAVLWSKSLAGGAVSSGNALRLRFDLQTLAASSFAVELNGVEVYSNSFWAGYQTGFLDVEIWRTGNTTATSVTTAVLDGVPCPIVATDLAGFAWTGSQTLVVTGYSTSPGGIALVRAGLQK